uniref:Uncharacterized protein n=1 Tax=Megaselia scalaris TaxID=36166 RepID=T1GWF8_MEGSC
MDGLEKAVNDLVPAFDLKIEQAFVNAKVMEAEGYKSEIDRSFSKMKIYLRNLSSFENVTLKGFSSEMNTEALFHNYHDMFFNNKDSKQKSLFELLTDLFINEGALNRICLNQEFLPQLQIRNYYEQISFVELKANVDFLAFCDDENDPKTERRFSTHLVSSDVQSDYIITGVRIAKKYKTIYLEVQQGKLRPMGHIDQSTISWKPSTDNLNQFISVNHKTKVHISRNYKDTENYVLTHVGFESSNNELFVKMGLTKVNFTAGKLIGQTIYLDSRKSDLPSSMKHNIVENGFLHFVASSKSLDAGQSTVPYLDTGNVEVRGGSLLNGFGLHYKESKGYGGFVGLSVNVYNHNKHIDEIVSSL